MIARADNTEGTKRDAELHLDPEVSEALTDFRLSVEAWSDAAAGRARPAPAPVRINGWRLASGAALACLLAAATITAVGLRHHGHELADRVTPRSQAVPAQEKAPAAIEQKPEAVNRQKTAADGADPSDDQLLAAIDNDVARQVPSAMEPLAQLGDESQTQ